MFQLTREIDQGKSFINLLQNDGARQTILDELEKSLPLEGFNDPTALRTKVEADIHGLSTALTEEDREVIDDAIEDTIENAVRELHRLMMVRRIGTKKG